MTAIPTLAWFALILAASLFGNAALYNAWDGQKKKVVEVQLELRTALAERDSASDAAQACSVGVRRLSTLAEQRAKEAAKARQQAADRARQHNRRADAVLAAPPAVPGNDCASADARMRQWLKSRQ